MIPQCFTYMGYLGLFLVGGLTGLFLSSMGLDIHLHDTYFVGGALPLYYGWRPGDGISGGHALLVAENYGQDVSRYLGTRFGPAGISRF